MSLNKYIRAASVGAIIGLSIIGLASTLGYELQHPLIIIGCPVLTSVYTVARFKED